MSNTKTVLASRNRQRGAELIEFAFVVMIFLVLLIGIMEFGRWLYSLNAASEATRWAARMAVVCGTTKETLIEQRAFALLRNGNGGIDVVYPASTCTADCMVTASLTGATFTPLIPFLDASFAMPSFTTTIPVEAMGSAGIPDDVCP
jgi:Flp pilus assembly protein TadG